MRVSVFILLLSTVYSLSEGIDLSLCSSDRLYCFDPITQSIVKVGAHSLSAPFGLSAGESSLTMDESVPEGMSGTVHAAGLIRDRHSAGIRPMYRIGRVSSGLRLAPECGVGHDPVSCRVIPSTEAVAVTRSPVRETAVAAVTMKEPVVHSVGAAIADPCSDPPIVTQTEDSVCYTKPKKKFMTVQCCKTSKIPVKQNREQEIGQSVVNPVVHSVVKKVPCVCADGEKAEAVVYPSVRREVGEVLVGLESVLRRVRPVRRLGIPEQAYLNELLDKESRIRKNIIELTQSEQDNIVGEQDKMELMRAIRKV